MATRDQADNHAVTFINAEGIELLARVARSALLQHSIEQAQREAVLAAQEHHSWAEIGAALGISKQAAHRKFVTYLADELKAQHRDMKAARRSGQVAKYLTAHADMASIAARLQQAQHGE